MRARLMLSAVLLAVWMGDLPAQDASIPIDSGAIIPCELVGSSRPDCAPDFYKDLRTNPDRRDSAAATAAGETINPKEPPTVLESRWLACLRRRALRRVRGRRGSRPITARRRKARSRSALGWHSFWANGGLGCRSKPRRTRHPMSCRRSVRARGPVVFVGAAPSGALLAWEFVGGTLRPVVPASVMAMRTRLVGAVLVGLIAFLGYAWLRRRGRIDVPPQPESPRPWDRPL